MPPAAIAAAIALLVPGGAAFGAPVEARAAKIPKPAPDSEERIALAKVQVFLDREGFRPGKIDGLGGEFTQRAADRWCDANGLPRGSTIDVSSIARPYRRHIVSEEDAAWVGAVSSDPEKQAKFRSLKYGDLWEAVAERFHCDRNFLLELNPDVPRPAAGVELRVPDVGEFRMADVKALEKSRNDAAGKPPAAPAPAASAPRIPPAPPLPQPFEMKAPVSGSAEIPAPAPPSPPPPPQPVPTPVVQRRVVLLRAERMIEVFEDGRIVACFPCTPGSSKFPVPPGIWKITGNVLMPHFRWDKSVLETGVRSDNAHLLPPGPNSPVGIVWMGINRPSLGIHGTNSPDRIGRNESSGCIRLANWDAFLLCQLVRKGTPVEVR